MEELYPVLLILSVVFALVSIAIAFVFYRKYQKLIKPKIDVESDLSKEDQQLIKKIKDPLVNEPCINHPKEIGQGVCAICAAVLCEECVKEHDGLNFCIEHFKTYLENDWQDIETILTTPDTPEVALPLYHFKNNIWQDEIPSIIRTHYRINIERDIIESHVSLLVKRDDYSHLDYKWKTEQN